MGKLKTIIIFPYWLKGKGISLLLGVMASSVNSTESVENIGMK